MNYRDLQNISNLSQQILVEGAKEEHNVLNRWPYTSPYLQENDSQVCENQQLDEAAVNWNTGKTKSGLSPEEKTTLKFVQHGLSDKPQNQKRAEQQALVHQNMTDAIKKTGKRKVDKVGPIASKRFKNAAIRKRGGKQPSVPIKTVSGLKDANKESQSKLNKEQVDLYDIILSHLLDEGYAETQEQAEVIMVNMSEEWRESIFEATVLAAKGGVAGAVQVKQTKTPGFLGTGIGSKTVSTPIPGTFTRNTPGRVRSGPRPFDAYGSGSKGAEAEMSDRSGPTDAERNRYNAAVTKNNTVGDKSVAPSPRAVNQRANQKGHSGLMPTRDNQNSTRYSKPNDSWRGY